jgi:hypothetical protein
MPELDSAKSKWCAGVKATEKRGTSEQDLEHNCESQDEIATTGGRGGTVRK